MAAFNGRFVIKRWFGVPAHALGSGVIALPIAIIALLTQIWLLKAFCILIALICIAIGIVIFIMGAEWQFISIILASRRERTQITADGMEWGS